MTIIVSSTTGTQQDVDDAANWNPDAESAKPVRQVESEVEGQEPEAESAAESEPAEEPESAEQEEESSEEEEQPEEPPEAARRGTKSRLVQRVNQLVGQRYALQDEVHQLREQVRQLQDKDKDQQPASPQALRRPDPSDAKYKGRPYEEFVEDLADFKVKEREQAKAQAEHEAFVRSIFDDYNAQVEVARSRYEDFDEVVGKDVQVPVIAINAMYELDNGPEVAYYLGKHPEVREQLLEWNEPGTKGGVRRIVVELDRISRELGSPPAVKNNGKSSPQPRPQTSTVPAPIKPLGGASSTTRSTATDPGNLDYQQYKRWYQKNYGGR